MKTILSDPKKSKDAEDILSEFQESQPEPAKEPEVSSTEQEPEPEVSSTEQEPEPEVSSTEQEPEPEVSSTEQEPEPEVSSTEQEPKENDSAEIEERDVIFVGTKPIMTYVTATLTQLANNPTVTIKARGKRITQAVDVSQMIVKRMDTVGYKINDVRIASDSLKSQDGKQRNVSTIEIDITKN